MRRGAVGLGRTACLLFYLWSYLPNEQKRGAAGLASVPGTRLSPRRAPGECGAVTAPRDGSSGRPFPALAQPGPVRLGAGSDWREPSPSAPRFLISSVRIGRKKKSGKADLTLQLSVWRVQETLPEFGGLEMRLKEENPHPRNEAKAVRTGGQVSERIARVRLWMGKVGFQPGIKAWQDPAGSVSLSH